MLLDLILQATPKQKLQIIAFAERKDEDGLPQSTLINPETFDRDAYKKGKPSPRTLFIRQ